jgi:hypothetical protein
MGRCCRSVVSILGRCTAKIGWSYNSTVMRSTKQPKSEGGQLSFVADLARLFRALGIPRDRMITEEFAFR